MGRAARNLVLALAAGAIALVSFEAGRRFQGSGAVVAPSPAEVLAESSVFAEDDRAADGIRAPAPDAPRATLEIPEAPEPALGEPAKAQAPTLFDQVRSTRSPFGDARSCVASNELNPDHKSLDAAQLKELDDLIRDLHREWRRLGLVESSAVDRRVQAKIEAGDYRTVAVGEKVSPSPDARVSSTVARADGIKAVEIRPGEFAELDEIARQKEEWLAEGHTRIKAWIAAR